MKIPIYNQNCNLAGRVVPQDKLQQFGEDCEDWTWYDESDLDWLRKHAERESGSNRVYLLRVIEVVEAMAIAALNRR